MQNDREKKDSREEKERQRRGETGSVTGGCGVQVVTMTTPRVPGQDPDLAKFLLLWFFLSFS